MNVELPIWRHELWGHAEGERPRSMRRTYRFPDGVRVIVQAYDVVVWVYTDGHQVKSKGVEIRV